MLLFSSEEHVERWCRDWRFSRGATLSLEQGWRLARAWYGADRGDASWRRPTIEEAEVLLSGLGLVGAFWSLRGER